MSVNLELEVQRITNAASVLMDFSTLLVQAVKVCL